MQDLFQQATATGQAYTAKDIEVLEGLEPVRRRPAMYIGGSWVTTEETRPVINPADESVIAAVPEPSTYFAGAFALLVGGWKLRRHRTR